MSACALDACRRCAERGASPSLGSAAVSRLRDQRELLVPTSHDLFDRGSKDGMNSADAGERCQGRKRVCELDEQGRTLSKAAAAVEVVSPKPYSDPPGGEFRVEFLPRSTPARLVPDTTAQTPSSRRNPHCCSSTAATDNTEEPNRFKRR